MNPLKILEYLAAEKPVVATPLPALRAYVPHVGIAGSAAEFASAVEQALADDSNVRRSSRAEFARQHSWESRLGEICALIEMTAAMKGMARKNRDASNTGSRVPVNPGPSERPVGGPR